MAALAGHFEICLPPCAPSSKFLTPVVQLCRDRHLDAIAPDPFPLRLGLWRLHGSARRLHTPAGVRFWQEVCNMQRGLMARKLEAAGEGSHRRRVH